MKSMGIVRKIDDLGRLVIPKELRDSFDLPIGTPMEVFTDDGAIVLKKYAPGCTFCGSMDDLKSFGGQNICGKCRSEIRKKL